MLNNEICEIYTTVLCLSCDATYSYSSISNYLYQSSCFQHNLFSVPTQPLGHVRDIVVYLNGFSRLRTTPLNKAKTQIFQFTDNFEIFEIYLYFVSQPACLPAVRPSCGTEHEITVGHLTFSEHFWC